MRRPYPSERSYRSPAALTSPLQFSTWAFDGNDEPLFSELKLRGIPFVCIQNPRARMTYRLSRSQRAQTLWWTRLGSFFIERRTSKTPVGPRQPHDQGHVRVDGTDRRRASSQLDLSSARPGHLSASQWGRGHGGPWQSSRWGSASASSTGNHVGSSTSVMVRLRWPRRGLTPNVRCHIVASHSEPSWALAWRYNHCNFGHGHPPHMVGQTRRRTRARGLPRFASAHRWLACRAFR